MKIELQGTIEKVQPTRTTSRGSVWPFILKINGNSKNPQHYIITAFSDSHSEDSFGLMDLENCEVKIACYLNGKQYTGKDKSIRHTNELKLISIKRV